MKVDVREYDHGGVHGLFSGNLYAGSILQGRKDMLIGRETLNGLPLFMDENIAVVSLLVFVTGKEYILWL